MLIHVTRYIRWQNHLYNLIQDQFDYYRRGIDQNMFEIVEEFRKTFEEDSENYKSYKTITGQIKNSTFSDIDAHIELHDWNDVLNELNNAASNIVVREVNGGSGDILNYFDHVDGLSVIAVGGDKLSRGLTLEGLSVSYYLRSSKMYDTLMQMGRWFGYRPGYVDLCRLFTSRELNEWFCHITHASEELREEFDYLSDVADSTPEKYALKVRTHPGVLQITSSNKMKSTIDIRISWAGRLVESYELRKSNVVMKNNITTTKNFINSLSGCQKKDNSFLWYDIPADLIKTFFREFQILDNLKAYDPVSLIRFIDLQIPNGELTNWRVALMSKRNATFIYNISVDGSQTDIGSFVRKEDENNSSKEIYYIRKSHIISPKDEFIDLTESEYIEALAKTEEAWQKKKKTESPTYPNGEIVRNEIRKPQNPLLLIYLLDPEGAKMEDKSIPFVGYAVSFPGSKFTEFVSYTINENLIDKFDFEDNINENYDDED